MNIRWARPTNNLEQLKIFYTEILGFELLGSFENHDGYDGIFIGKSNSDWHLEFTQTKEKVALSFDEESILVFYPTSKLEFELLMDNLTKKQINFIKAKNPFWNANGKMILDPDGYRIVICDLKIK